MLSVGIVGNDADRRAAVADLVGLGALVVEPGSELVWDVVAPLIAIHDCGAKGSCRQIEPLQIVVGAGSAPEEASEADVWMGDGDVGSCGRRGWYRSRETFAKAEERHAASTRFSWSRTRRGGIRRGG